MKSKIIILSLAGVLVSSVFCKAQGVPGDPKPKTEEKSILDLMAEISANMLKAAKGSGNGFSDFRGDYIQETRSGNVFYTVKSLQLHADTAFIVKKSNGGYVLLASYKQKNDDDELPATAYMSFTTALQSQAGKNFVTAMDTAPQDHNIIKYYLEENGVKIASFTFNTNTKQGTFLTPVQ